MAITISDISPRIQYTATAGQTSFTVPFEFFDDDDLVVVNTSSGGVDTTLTKAASPSTVTQYSVTGAGVTGGGSITLGAGATLNDTYTITRNVPIARSTDFATTGVFPIDSLNTELDKIVAMMQQQGVDINLSPRAASTTSTAYGLIFPELTANKVLSVNSNGDGLIFTQEIGNYKGDWAASTAYVQRDLVKDTSNGNIYIVNTAHTSNGSQPLSSNANSSYYDLIVDAAAATTSATNAASSATAASTSASAAATSATNAATSATTATTKATEAATSASNASTSESNASTSESNASTSETNAASSATSAASSATTATTQASAASTSATNAASSATTATTKASEASTSASNAATSATTATTKASEAATSATNAATSETNAATSATNAATSATNASTSSTNAANSATAAAASAANAAASYDQFDDRYLGSKTSDPTVDNDGNALVSGALYFNSTANEMRVYDGANWIPSSSAGTASLVIYEYTATSGQTTFSGTDDNAATLSYSVNNLFVTLNGVVLDPDDYTATSGTSIVLGTGATTGDLLTVHAFKSFTVSELNANNLTDGTIPDARFPSVLPAVDGSNLTGISSFSNVVEDTTPQLGGNLDLNSNDITGTGNINITGNATISGDIAVDTSTFKLDSANNRVGIGNSSPISPLTVGAVQETGTDRASIAVKTISNSLAIGESAIQIEEQSGTEGYFMGVDSTGGLFFSNSGSATKTLYLGDDDNVGINEASPLGKLHVKSADSGATVNSAVDELVVENSGDTGITILSGTTNTGGVMFGDSGNNYMGGMIYQHNGNNLIFKGNGGNVLKIDSSGHVLPNSSNAQDLGSSSLVWRNIYTSDFHMSNEGLDKGNDIDGTKGSWTFQEGEENLYLINNKNGKKYKFNLTEIE